MTFPSEAAGRRSSTDANHWNPRESLVGSVADKSLMDATSPTSSITEHSASGVVNVLKIAQDWQQKQQEQKTLQERQQQEQQQEYNQESEQSLPLPEVRDNHPNKSHIRNATNSTTTDQSRRQEEAIFEKPDNANTSNNTESSAEFPLILEPKDLYQNDILSEDEIQELFVEMCFFARLGFVQPPCCLLCTYQESMDDAGPNKTCSRWVVWRRNAETPLHPNQLDGNILVTKCNVAQTLLEGETVDGYAWDSAHKQVVLCCSSSS